MGTPHAFFSFPDLRCCQSISRRQKLGSNNREFNKDREFNKGPFRTCSVGALPDWGTAFEGKSQ